MSAFEQYGLVGLAVAGVTMSIILLIRQNNNGNNADVEQQKAMTNLVLDNTKQVVALQETVNRQYETMMKMQRSHLRVVAAYKILNERFKHLESDMQAIQTERDRYRKLAKQYYTKWVDVTEEFKQYKSLRL